MPSRTYILGVSESLKFKAKQWVDCVAGCKGPWGVSIAQVFAWIVTTVLVLWAQASLDSETSTPTQFFLIGPVLLGAQLYRSQGFKGAHLWHDSSNAWNFSQPHCTTLRIRTTTNSGR